MMCAEKEELQRKCATAWEAFAAVAEQYGTVIPGTIGAMIASREYRANASEKSSYAAALRLRGEHLKASMELSRHLSRHRC